MKVYVDDFSSAGNLDSATSSDGLFGWGTSQIGSTGTKASGDVTFTQSDYVTDAECDTDYTYSYAVYVSHTGGGGWWIGLGKNSTYPGTGYLLNFTATDVTIYRINSGAYNSLATASHAVSAGTYRFEYNRATGDLTGYRNGASIITVNNTAEPSGSGFRKAEFGFDGGTNAVFSEFGYGDVVTATLEQEGFRFYNDDGDEDGSTASQAQDTNDTVALGTARHLRVLVNATLDPASIAYTLRAQKNGAGGYTAVAVGTSYIQTPVIEAGDVTESGNNTASTSWAVSHPAYVAGDLLVFHIASDADVTHNWSATGPNGETVNTIYDSTGGTAQRASAFWFVGTGTIGASTFTVTPSATEQWTAAVLKVPAGEFNASTPIQTNTGTANDTTADTAASTPAWTTDSTTDGRIVVWFAIDTVQATAAPAGWTIVASEDRGAVGGTLGIRDTGNTASESLSAVDFTMASETDTSIGYVINGPVITPEIFVATSANITAGGDATTARLTAPSGKSTSDFVTGRIWDNENGTDSIDITTDDYTEVAWNLNTQSPAVGGDYWDLRVYAGSVVLDTYTVTARLTLSGGGGGGTSHIYAYHQMMRANA